MYSSRVDNLSEGRSLENEKLLITLLVIVFAVKLPFIFHGKWDEKFFVPYMTDETVFLAPIYSYVVSGSFELEGVIAAYPPFLFNILFPYFYFLFKTLYLFTDKISTVTTYEIIYYNSRIFVLIRATIGTFYYVKLFQDIITVLEK